MKWWEDISLGLDQLFGVDKENHAGYDIGMSQYVDPRGISPSNDEFTLGIHRDVNTPDYETQIGISQQRNNPFTIYDINPYKLTDPQFNCTVPLRTIADKIGYDADSDSASGVPGVVTLAQWKTVTLTTPGDFLKLEFLPNKLNEVIFGTPINSEGFTKEDNTGDINTTLPSTNPAYQWFCAQKNSYGYVLIQFDDQNGPIHLVRQGTNFKCHFQKIFLTTRMLTPRFSLTIGNNASIIDDNTQQLLSANPAYGPGHGLWQNPSRHCVPFSLRLDENSVNAGPLSALPSPAIGNGFPATGNNIYQFVMFTGRNNVMSTYPNGVAIGWITAISLSAINLTDTSVAYMEAVVIKQKSSNNTIWKQYVSLPAIVGNTALQGAYGLVNVSKTFTEPIRFSIFGANAEQLMLQLRVGDSGNSAGLRVFVMIEGYTYGPATLNGGGYMLAYSDHNPFPGDARAGITGI